MVVAEGDESGTASRQRDVTPDEPVPVGEPNFGSFYCKVYMIWYDIDVFAVGEESGGKKWPNRAARPGLPFQISALLELCSLTAFLSIIPCKRDYFVFVPRQPQSDK